MIGKGVMGKLIVLILVAAAANFIYHATKQERFEEIKPKLFNDYLLEYLNKNYTYTGDVTTLFDVSKVQLECRLPSGNITGVKDPTSDLKPYTYRMNDGSVFSVDITPVKPCYDKAIASLIAEQGQTRSLSMADIKANLGGLLSPNNQVIAKQPEVLKKFNAIRADSKITPIEALEMIKVFNQTKLALIDKQTQAERDAFFNQYKEGIVTPVAMPSAKK